jgi:3-hydroxyisobutyrate dehydrogenase-like beta-hydroxyacid dehydrogenase
MSAGSKGTIGVIGLGIMGGAIARNLKAAGWRVVGYDIDAARNTELKAAGVQIAQSTGELARTVSLILTSLPDPRALETTVREIVAAGLDRRVVVELSTFSLDDKEKAERALRAAGHAMLDCPLSGTGAQARTKDLVVYASGDTAAIASLMLLFSDFAREAHDLGAFGNGSRMKFVANLLVAIHNVASAEAFVLGMKAGLDPQQILKLVSAGAGNSRVFELRGPMMAANRYDEATMKISTWQKDMAIIGKFARDLGCPTPLFSASEPVYAAALAGGHGAQDTAAVCAVLEVGAGLKRSPTR